MRFFFSGAYKYVEELWRKKQSDVLRFLLRVRCWEYRQLPGIVRITRPTRPDKARRLGYKAKQVNYVLCPFSSFLPNMSWRLFYYQLSWSNREAVVLDGLRILGGIHSVLHPCITVVCIEFSKLWIMWMWGWRVGTNEDSYFILNFIVLLHPSFLGSLFVSPWWTWRIESNKVCTLPAFINF